MGLKNKFEDIHRQLSGNRWMHRFALFTRIILAIGFIPPGLQKIMGERFTALANEHPMGSYLEALFHTGFYYPLIGVAQVCAAVLLLIPRTATLGALIYLPIILNICLLSYAVKFDGSIVTSPLMTLAVIFLLLWDYHKIKWVFPSFHKTSVELDIKKEDRSNKFPWRFGVLVLACFISVLLIAGYGLGMKPRNTKKECQTDCAESVNPEECLNFCDCIHIDGKSLNQCIEEYEKLKKIK